MKKSSDVVLQALGVTCELTGTELSTVALRVFAHDLSAYPEEQVLKSLARCRKEIRGRLALADVIMRLEDGRPGPEEAWAMIPRDEALTVVWTDEMREAWAVARPLLKDGDVVPARMAFLESYRTLILKAREAGAAPRWEPSIGWDAGLRASVLMEAVEKGRLSAQHVSGLLPYRDDPPPRMAELIKNSAKALQ